MDFKLNSLQQSPELKEVLGKVERKRRHDYRSRQPRQLPVGSHHTRHVFFHPTPLVSTTTSMQIAPDNDSQASMSFQGSVPLLATLPDSMFCTKPTIYTLCPPSSLMVSRQVLMQLFPSPYSPTLLSTNLVYFPLPCLLICPSRPSPCPPPWTVASLLLPLPLSKICPPHLSWGSTLPQFGYNVCVNFLTKSFQGPLAFSQEGQTP